MVTYKINYQVDTRNANSNSVVDKNDSNSKQCFSVTKKLYDADKKKIRVISKYSFIIIGYGDIFDSYTSDRDTPRRSKHDIVQGYLV